MNYPATDRLMSPSDLVGQSFRLVRMNWQFFLKILFWPTLAFTLAMHFWLQSFGAALGTALNFPVQWSTLLVQMGELLALFLVWVVLSWLAGLRSAAAIRVFLNLENTYEESLSALKRNLAAILFGYNLSFIPDMAIILIWLIVIFIGAGAISLIKGPVSGMLQFGFVQIIGVWACIGMALVGFCGSMFATVATVDLLAPRQCWRKTFEYIELFFIRTVWFAVLIALACHIAGLAINMPVSVWQAINSAMTIEGKVPKLPLLYDLLSIALSMVSSLISVPVSTAGFMLFYRDLKLRMEGNDLVNRLRQVESAEDT